MANTAAITILQLKLVTLGIIQVANGLITFIDTIHSDAVLSSQITKCMKLTGQQTLTGNITAANDDYTFIGAKSSQIGYLSDVKSNSQAQKSGKQARCIKIFNYLISQLVQMYILKMY